jgi:hypothetical protein
MSEAWVIPTPEPERADNLTSNEHCRYCCNDGWVIAGTSTWMGASFEVAAPCPACLRGHKIEFSKDGRWRWGPEGYWRGRPTGLTPSCPHRGVAPAQKEIVDEARALMALLARKSSEPKPISVTTPITSTAPGPKPETTPNVDTAPGSLETNDDEGMIEF